MYNKFLLFKILVGILFVFFIEFNFNLIVRIYWSDECNIVYCLNFFEFLFWNYIYISYERVLIVYINDLDVYECVVVFIILWKFVRFLKRIRNLVLGS